MLDVVFFDLAVLENYRNDPRYTFSYWDFGVQFHISDEAYLNPEEAERDKVSAAHVGIAYSADTTPEGPIRRYLAVFVKDLADMTPEHQQRWRTYQAEREDVRPHPQWYRGQVLGHWPDTTGPFTTCLIELDHLNQLSALLWNEPLFDTTDRPREWGWMIRGSRAAFREFAHLTDKLLADNLRQAGLDAAGAPTTKDGNRIGTLKRLEGLLVLLGVDEQLAYDAMGVWHEVNNVRHRQVHTLEEDAVDHDLLVAQVGVLRRLVNSLVGIRMTLAGQPGAEEWEPQHDFEEFSLL